MPFQVSRFGPPTLALALPCEHRDKGSWEKHSTSGILLLKRVNDVHVLRDDTSRWHASTARFSRRNADGRTGNRWYCAGNSSPLLLTGCTNNIRLLDPCLEGVCYWCIIGSEDQSTFIRRSKIRRHAGVDRTSV